MSCIHDSPRVLGEHEVAGKNLADETDRMADATLNEDGDVTVDIVCECGAFGTLQIFEQSILDNADSITWD